MVCGNHFSNFFHITPPPPWPLPFHWTRISRKGPKKNPELPLQSADSRREEELKLPDGGSFLWRNYSWDIQFEIRFANSQWKGRELEPGSGQRRAVQAQLGLTRGSWSAFARTSALEWYHERRAATQVSQDPSPGPHYVSFFHSRPSPCSEFLKKVNSRPKKSKNCLDSRPKGLGSGGETRSGWQEILV